MTTATRSSSRSACAALLLIVTACAGCMAPPVSWRHYPGEKQFTATGDSLVVLPVEDRRELHNDGPSLLNYVPLMLWTTQTDSMFDLILRQPGTRRGSIANPSLMFVAGRDLHEAMAQELGRGRCFGPVFRSHEESGPWPGADERQHTLLLRLNTLALKQVHLRYGLGPAAFALFMFGAPERHVRLVIDWRLELRDAEGRLTYESDLATSRVFYDGWYFSTDAEQRALDALSLILAEELDVLQEACAPNDQTP